MKTYKDWLLESNNSTLVIVDIQPVYEKYISFNLNNFSNYINKFSGDIHVFYNGEDFGLDKKEDIINWYYDNGVKEKTLDKLIFFEKNYAFFRDLMDTGVDEEKIIEIGKLMIKNKKYDIRDLIEDELSELGLDDDFDVNDYGFYIPDVLLEIQKLPNNCILIGGGKDECLAEVELCFKMLNKPYKLNYDLIY